MGKVHCQLSPVPTRIPCFRFTDDNVTECFRLRRFGGRSGPIPLLNPSSHCCDRPVGNFVQDEYVCSVAYNANRRQTTMHNRWISSVRPDHHHAHQTRHDERTDALAGTR
jgi:hypothetical protein